ncbi:UNVERIFIED_CONTAM: hypothetical protein PYX00_003936 [Menopon gallinae]|uniref:Uncharacterized protein n=1 Tax=Menopon gallinae TaxID=328185 RepID=A0AAW2I2S2_9NEOP
MNNFRRSATTWRKKDVCSDGHHLLRGDSSWGEAAQRGGGRRQPLTLVESRGDTNGRQREEGSL